jgi:methyl-accepting chemotaxis protein
LKDTASEVNGIARDIKSEVSKWRTDVNIVKTKLENVRSEIVGTIDDGIAQTNSVIGKTEEVLAKIKQIESDIDGLSTKIENIKGEAVNKIENEVEKIKEEPVDALKGLFNKYK